MTVTAMLGTALRVLAVGAAYLVCLTVSFGLLVPPAPVPPGAFEPLPAGTALAIVAVLNTAVVAWLILRSHRRGWALAATLTVVVFAVHTFMPQVESLIFLAYPSFAAHLPAAVIPRLMAAGLLHACLWTPLAVWILGRWSAGARGDAPPSRRSEGWAWKLPLAAVLYVAVYFTFGHYVAWRSPAVRAYYGGGAFEGFWSQIGNVLRDTPWLPLAQVARGLVWACLAIVVVRLLKGSVLEKALAVGALFAVVMNSGLLLPNPYMPYEVRMVHLLETASSNFLFGAVVGWMFGRNGGMLRLPSGPGARP
jgi:hypothetical protein